MVGITASTSTIAFHCAAALFQPAKTFYILKISAKQVIIFIVQIKSNGYSLFFAVITIAVQVYLVTTSGAIQYGVPTIVSLILLSGDN